MFEFENIDVLIDRAEEESINERKQYTYIYDIVEKFIKDEELFLGGKLGTKLLLKKKRTKDDYVYIIFCERPLKYANTLTNRLAKYKYVIMKTMSLGKEFHILFDNRLIAKFYDLEIHKGIHTKDLIKAEPVYFNAISSDSPDSFTGEKFLVLPAEIQLINVYRRLYNPNNISKWESLLEREQLLYDKINFKKLEIVKGGENKITNKVKENIREMLWRKYLHQSHIVILGMEGIDLIKNDEINIKLRPKITTTNSIDIEIKNIERYVRTLYGNWCSVDYKIQKLMIPKDFRINRYSVFISDGDSTVPILDMFNSAEFELIPFNKIEYNKIEYKIANPFVILRFILIDIWIRKLLNVINKKYSDDDSKYKMRQLISDYKTVRGLLSEEKYSKLCFGKDYLGIYRPESTDKKILMLNASKPNYIPLEYQKRTGNFRDIN